MTRQYRAILDPLHASLINHPQAATTVRKTQCLVYSVSVSLVSVYLSLNVGPEVVIFVAGSFGFDYALLYMITRHMSLFISASSAILDLTLQ
jgi:hypothetical protein